MRSEKRAGDEFDVLDAHALGDLASKFDADELILVVQKIPGYVTLCVGDADCSRCLHGCQKVVLRQYRAGQAECNGREREEKKPVHE